MKKLLLTMTIAATMCLAVSGFAAERPTNDAKAPGVSEQVRAGSPVLPSAGEREHALKEARAKFTAPDASPAERAGAALEWVVALLFGSAGVALGMTTLAVKKPRTYEGGRRNTLPVIDNDILYEGAAIGVVTGTGHTRPLAAGDRFAGFAEASVDNTVTGHTAAGVNVDVIESGKIQLAVTGATITDVGQPVYATDDDTFTLSPVGGVFVGFVHRYVSAGVAVVAFDALNFRDPWAAYSVRETLSANKTVDAEDSGKLFWVDTDAFTITLPVVATGTLCAIVNGGSYGTIAVTVSPAAADSIEAPDITAADDKDIINTKATAQRGDYVKLGDANADGYIVTEMRGTWARQA